MVDAVTAVVQSTMRRVRAVTQPTASSVLGALSLALQVAGVSPRGRVHVERVDCETSPERVRLGGHIGASGCIVGWMDYEDALVAEAASAQRIATQRSEQLIACLNGKPPGLYTENHRGERTYIVCREAEEIPVGKVRS
jgi:hypothetical protein